VHEEIELTSNGNERHLRLASPNIIIVLAKNTRQTHLYAIRGTSFDESRHHLQRVAAPLISVADAADDAAFPSDTSIRCNLCA